MTASDVLISGAELAERLSSPQLRLLDVRWTVMKPDGRDAYLAGHLPGAVFVDLDTELSNHDITGRGRHPLPTFHSFEASARRWGINAGDLVVVYDDWNGQAAARAWWLLRAAGISTVRILDGGWSQWQRAGLPTETGDVTAVPGTVTIENLAAMPSTDGDTVAAQGLSDDTVVLDARAGARYRGDEEPMDPRAGHIPGALSAPTSENLTADGTFRSVDDLRERFGTLGADAKPVTVYCGSGVTASHQIAALAIAGIDATLYPGSWSEWSSRPDRPVATGTQP